MTLERHKAAWREIERQMAEHRAYVEKLEVIAAIAREMLAEGRYIPTRQCLSGVGSGNRLRDAIDDLDAPQVREPDLARWRGAFARSDSDA